MDILIKNGTVVDGSGAPAVRQDVAVKDGRVVERGKINGRAAKTIDAEGQIVCPGFIDIHTHYDPHWWWNPLGTPSSWQGVTTVVTGNCGLTLAPCKPRDQQLLAGIFGRVEELSLATMNAVVPWTWETFREHTDRLEDHVGINVALLLGHNAVRLYVMGEASGERAATEDEVGRMKDVVRLAMEAGAFGWSTTRSPTHVGPTGAPIPSRLASDEELFELASVLAEYKCGAIQGGGPSRGVIREMALRAARPIIGGAGAWTWYNPDLWRDQQRWMAEVAKEGATVFSTQQLQSTDRVVNYKRTTFFNGMEIWRDIMSLPLEERKTRLADPALRPALRYALDHPDMVGRGGQVRPPIRWEAVTVSRANLTQNKHMEGRCVMELAKERGVHVADFMTDLSLEEGLETEFLRRNELESDFPVIGELMQSPFVILGTSDSGAHINSQCKSGEPTYCMRFWVKDRNIMSLEEAIRRWTSVPAGVFGLPDRGLIREGMKADIVVFSPQDVEPGQAELVQDVPGGETRWIQKANGISHTIVNGRILMHDNVPSGDVPGEVLRSAAYRPG